MTAEYVLDMNVAEMIREDLRDFRNEVREKLEEIVGEARKTNGRVTELEKVQDKRAAHAIETAKGTALLVTMMHQKGFWVFMSILAFCVITGLTLRNEIGPICQRILAHWGY